MAEGRLRAEWAQTASIMALVANLHRDPKQKPIGPDAFDPFAVKQEPQIIPADIGVLKSVFVKPAG